MVLYLLVVGLTFYLTFYVMHFKVKVKCHDIYWCELFRSVDFVLVIPFIYLLLEINNPMLHFSCWGTGGMLIDCFISISKCIQRVTLLTKGNTMSLSYIVLQRK